MRKQLTIFCLCLLGFGSLIAQDGRIEFEEYNLSNGMHVILHQDNSTPIVAISVLYHVGSKDEDPKRTGFAHFFEHLMFEGTEHIGRGDYMKIVQGAGGELNANTSFDRTYYYEVLPSNQLELGLWMESERLLHAKIDSVGVETQRAVVKEERSQRIDNQPYGSVLEEVSKRAFVEHPYRWTPIGSRQYIDQATIEEFQAFYEKFYVPNNATLTIAGDIDIANAKALVKKYFGSINKGGDKIPRTTIVEPQKTEEVRDVIYDNVQLPAVIHAYHSPGQGSDDYYAMSLLSTLLTGGESSRLTKNIVDKKQLAIFTGAFPFPSEDPGLTYIFAVANMGIAPEKLEEAIDLEIEKVQNELISEKEYEKLLNQVESQWVSQKSSMVGIAELLANYYVYYGDANLINSEINRYKKVTREDIRRVAKKYMKTTNRVALYYVAKTGKE